MARKRVIDGEEQPFTCENAAFHTDTAKGKPHGVGNARGSVLEEPLVDRDGNTLWLEHVWNFKEEYHCYWLMWYRHGHPNIPLSGIFFKEDLLKMIQKLISFNEDLLQGDQQ